jgi:NAD(P)-dependent dehydrogenase (short-subunit alcohol dehydrogenase family)
MAQRFAQEGMKIVLADIEQGALEQTASEMRQAGASVLAVRTDVSKPEEVQALADATLREFGAVHVVCNNAGVVPPGGFLWEMTLADWQWVMGVNLWGVIHGVKVFVPIMLKQGSEGHIVNTASMAGLITGPFFGIYSVAKHAVVALSEDLYHEFNVAGAKLRVSVLCPAWVRTNLADADRNRPPELLNAPGERPASPVGQAAMDSVRQLLATGMAPEQVAEEVFRAVRDEKLYILPHRDRTDVIRTRMENIVAERNPETVVFT